MGRAGPGLGLIIQFAGTGRDSTTAEGLDRPGPQIIFAGRAWVQISYNTHHGVGLLVNKDLNPSFRQNLCCESGD